VRSSISKYLTHGSKRQTSCTLQTSTLTEYVSKRGNVDHYLGYYVPSRILQTIQCCRRVETLRLYLRCLYPYHRSDLYLAKFVLKQDFILYCFFQMNTTFTCVLCLGRSNRIPFQNIDPKDAKKKKIHASCLFCFWKLNPPYFSI
jgi:hypothetical protein